MGKYRVNSYFHYQFKKPVEIMTINNVIVEVKEFEVQSDSNAYFFNDTGNSIYDNDTRRKVYCNFTRLFESEFIQIFDYLSEKQVNYLKKLIANESVKFASHVLN